MASVVIVFLLYLFILYFILQKADFKLINQEINYINWENLINSLTVAEFPDRFRCLIFSILKNNCPIKNINPNFSNPYRKSRKVLARKIRKLNNKLCNIPFNSPNYNSIKEKIKLLKGKQIQSFQKERISSENSAVCKINKDKKYFFKYVNKFKTTLSSPSILIDKNNKIITDPTLQFRSPPASNLL